MNLRADLNGYFGGKHFVRSYGQTVEFADYREYQLGDDIRRIDWNLFSRFEKYFIRLLPTRQMDVQIFLDCSASMGKENRAKAEYAVSVAAALGFLSVHNMDKVSFKLIKEDAVDDPFGTIIGKNSFFRAISFFGKSGFLRRREHFAGGVELRKHGLQQRIVRNHFRFSYKKGLEKSR